MDSDSEDESEENGVDPICVAEAQRSLDKLRTFFSQHDVDDTVFGSLQNLEAVLVSGMLTKSTQTKIKYYFA